MDNLEKMRLLCNEAAIEAAEGKCLQSGEKQIDGVVISHATLPNGKRIRILKSLLSSFCENDCHYCGLRCGRDTRRASFSPSEFAWVIVNLTQAGLIHGAFISSGVAGGGIRTMDSILAAAEHLRKKFHYQGYLHLKIMPGAEYDQVYTALILADRISVNLEAPNRRRLSILAPRKKFFEQLWQPLGWANKIRQQPTPPSLSRKSWPSVSTQFVVGASQESDMELLSVSQILFSELDLSRIYFSALKPIRDTPLENHPGIATLREHRLYQASFLMRDYGFQWQEIPLDSNGYLKLDHDPKTLWAQEHLSQKPLEINRASPEELVRVPGIGPIGIKAILHARKMHSITDLSMLSGLGIQVRRASRFILINGRKPAIQPTLFS